MLNLIWFRNYKKLPTIQSNQQRMFKVVWLLLLFISNVRLRSFICAKINVYKKYH